MKHTKIKRLNFFSAGRFETGKKKANILNDSKFAEQRSEGQAMDNNPGFNEEFKKQKINM